MSDFVVFGRAALLAGLVAAVGCSPVRSGDAVNRAGELYNEGRFEDALKAYKEAAALTPSYGWAHFGMGNCLRALKRTGEAIDAYREAVRLMPENAEAQHWLGVELYEANKDEDAIEPLNQAIRLNASDWRPRAQLAMVFARLGRHSEAVQAFEEATRLSSNWAQSWPEAARQYEASKALTQKK